MTKSKTRPLKILTAGGGSGGHVTPVAAVIAELKELHPRAKISFWTDTKFWKPARKIIASRSRGVRMSRILSGKFRRYSGFTILDYIKNPSIPLLNLRDLFLVTCGLVQCFFKLLANRPDIIFLKGGYVCLPIGLSARFLRIPFIIHESDTISGLTNRLLASHATAIATGMPLENYNYPTERTHHTGIPISPDFHPTDAKTRRALKSDLNLDPSKPLVVIGGGGLGARRINEAVVAQLTPLCDLASITLITGADNYTDVKQSLPSSLPPNFHFHALLAPPDYTKHLCAADIVVARAGATSIAELAATAKTSIIVPNAQLPGHHQTKNAEFLKKHHAALIVNDESLSEDPAALTRAVAKLLKDPALADSLATQLHTIARPDAAQLVARLILDSVTNQPL